ncbi:MAG: hypothetical protein COU31_01060 [Candidatus Magasanikbacteria bacterium CG10_big_fil_rev_8_21_14_0_10_40_10]|uniref:Radical SAM core domain-containing protein n=1 Tax=Candidatus Magasanikbacteria bacterium CG10_big_fil_rev_8_21_14_0_10_40_10 TaxID=1974648 RepID=A0A2M6W4Z2_9BACT|nr:MAG: hypothetical protein COU31_01060 [Candidatus Magasanikbacteria bacterium CG10_big_fil_rev_8_21_14_0_10_40_10]
MKCHLPIDCVLAVTYNCNSRCVMCDIWKIKDFAQIAPSEFAKLPDSLRDINISGGEPFLRPDLSKIIQTVVKACPKARIVISSNGFATDLIIKQMRQILTIKPDIGVAISIDGIGAVHDKMRGISGGFEKAMKTVKELKDLGMTNLRLAFTVSRRNLKQVTQVYDLAISLGLQFTHSFAQSSEFYFGGKQNNDFDNNNRSLKEILQEQYNYIIKTELKSWNLKKWARAYYAQKMLEFVLSKKQPLSNAPGMDFFFMDPAGEIYPSVIHNFKMGKIGDVADGQFEQFWCSSRAEEIRAKTRQAKIPVWMICTARTAIRRHPWSVGWWVLKKKLRI